MEPHTAILVVGIVLVDTLVVLPFKVVPYLVGKLEVHHIVIVGHRIVMEAFVISLD